MSLHHSPRLFAHAAGPPTCPAPYCPARTAAMQLQERAGDREPTLLGLGALAGPPAREPLHSGPGRAEVLNRIIIAALADWLGWEHGC